MMRIKLIGIVIFIFFLLLCIDLFYLQVIKGHYYQVLSTKNRIRLVSIQSPRGRIFDRNDKLLVDNSISFDVSAVPQELKNKKETIKELGEILDITTDVLNSAFDSGFVSPFQPVKLVSDIGKEKAIILEERRFELPGVFIETRPHRHYVYGSVASHILGYLGKINPREFVRLKPYGYMPDDLIGRAGIEKFYDDYLKGKRGGMQVEVDNRGYQVGLLGIKEPVKGKDIYLTIDVRLQEFIEEIFTNARGGVCVMKPQDGEILALVSSPSFDPNIFVTKESAPSIKKLLSRDDYPMLNRIVQCAYPPGSIFKLVTATAVLEEHKVSEKTEFSCNGTYSLGDTLFRCWRKKGHGRQTMREAIKNSCNVFFYQVGRIAGVDKIATYGNRFGFGRPTGIDLPNEIGGIVPNRMWKLLKKREPWYEGETLNYAIGQGYLLVTPIQILRMTSAIANGGFLVKPYLVKRIDYIDISQSRRISIGISEETLGVLIDGMIKVVNDSDGTGRKAAVEGLSIAGKTGTAQTSTDRTHAWFTGFAPARDPRVALVVFLEYGGKGGLSASKTARQIFIKLKELGYL